MPRPRRWVVGSLLLALMVVTCSDAALADQAPFWESPVGLVPGHPDIQVRMAAETVDVEIVERGDEIHAVVEASFTMANDGPDATVKVGFPATTYSLFDQLAEPDAEGRRVADAPVLFSPHAIRAFTVAIGGQELRSWRQDVPAAAEAGFGADWLMWETTFPAGQTTRVDVAYEQVLTDRASDQYVQPMYVLRTGALWPGTIGDATITLRATGGGALVGGPELYMRPDGAGGVATYPRAEQVYGPADAVESSPTRIVWQFADLEPTRDVGATYVRASAWRAYADADQAILEGGASDPAILSQAASAALDILGGPVGCGAEGESLCLAGPHRVPRGLVDRLADTARERARQAIERAPDDPSALLAYGDLEFWFAMPAEKHLGELACWPSTGVDAYERAASADVPGAAPRLAGMQAAARQVRFFANATIDTCSGEYDRRLDVELIKATIDQGNNAWSRGIGRGGDTEGYGAYFGGRWLEERTADVANLRANRQYREASLQAFELIDVHLHDAESASAETVETWEDRTHDEGGALLRDASGQLRQRYYLRKLDGQWKIVDGVVIRD